MNWLELLLKSTVVLASAALASALLRNRSAAVRHLVWAVATAAVLLLPFASVTVPALPVKALAPVGTVINVYGGDTAAPGPVRWTDWIVPVWTAGSALLLARLAFALAGLVRLTTSCRRLNLPGTGRVRVFAGPRVRIPTTWGVLRPVVLLPADAPEWPAERLSVVLQHELGHVRRLDWLTQLLAHFACALYWFHPLAWYAAAELRRERELACDDSVLARGLAGSEYAGHLLAVARALTTDHNAFTVGVAMAQQSNLETRVRAMLNPGLRREQVTRKLFTLASVVVLAALLPIAAVKAPAQSSGAGKISGIVYDASGAVVPNARVVLRNTEGRNTELTRTNPAGEFEIANMPTGKYNLEVAARGFEMYKVAALDITSGASIRQNVVLQLGKITENIDVVGTSPVSKPAQSIAGAPIKVGGSTQALRMVHMVRPSYPATMKAQGIEGIVLMKAVIGREGQILNIEVLNTQVHPDLVEAAKEAVSQWRYEPTLLNGEPVEVMTEITVNFTLAK